MLNTTQENTVTCTVTVSHFARCPFLVFPRGDQRICCMYVCMCIGLCVEALVRASEASVHALIPLEFASMNAKSLRDNGGAFCRVRLAVMIHETGVVCSVRRRYDTAYGMVDG